MKLPPFDLLTSYSNLPFDKSILQKTAESIESVLKANGVQSTIKEVYLTPPYANYIIEAKNISLLKLTSLRNDLCLVINSFPPRISIINEEKSLFSIEIPYDRKVCVSLKTMMEDYDKSGLKYKIPVMLGVNSFGKNEYADLTELKSILMGGTTGSGKSVFGNAIISSLLFRFLPCELKLLLIDMKRVEFSIYNGLPHLLTDCIVDSGITVKWLKKVLDDKKKSKLIKPYTFIVIDTSSDILISEFQEEFIKLITQITNEGPDLGIYTVMYDSRVGNEVFPAIFLKNFKTHICFNTADGTASKILINSEDGQFLLGRGDMLLKSGDSQELKRIQAPLISEKEILKITGFINTTS